jgi:hypothetical protein
MNFSFFPAWWLVSVARLQNTTTKGKGPGSNVWTHVHICRGELPGWGGFLDNFVRKNAIWHIGDLVQTVTVDTLTNK